MTLGLRDAKNLVLINRARVVELGDLADPKLDSSAFDRIVKTLAVRYYVSGTYQRAGEEIRVVARLVDATQTRLRYRKASPIGLRTCCACKTNSGDDS